MYCLWMTCPYSVRRSKYWNLVKFKSAGSVTNSKSRSSSRAASDDLNLATEWRYASVMIGPKGAVNVEFFSNIRKVQSCSWMYALQWEVDVGTTQAAAFRGDLKAVKKWGCCKSFSVQHLREENQSALSPKQLTQRQHWIVEIKPTNQCWSSRKSNSLGHKQMAYLYTCFANRADSTIRKSARGCFSDATW